jgi:hypothetical protein
VPTNVADWKAMAVWESTVNSWENFSLGLNDEEGLLSVNECQILSKAERETGKKQIVQNETLTAQERGVTGLSLPSLLTATVRVL